MQEIQKRLSSNTAMYNDINQEDQEARTKITSRDLSLNKDDLHKVHVFSCIGDLPIMKKPLDAYDELRYTIYPISMFYYIKFKSLCYFLLNIIKYYQIGLALSVVFLVATLAVGFLVPGNHHALHWRCQTYYVTCLLFGDTLLAISQLAGRDMGAKSCVAIGK